MRDDRHASVGGVCGVGGVGGVASEKVVYLIKK